MVGDFNTPLLSMARLSRQKISKKALALYDTLPQRDLKTYAEHSIQKQQALHSSQVHSERSPG